MAIHLHRMPLYLGLAAGAILAAAVGSEIALDLEPCALCLYQRWPHAIAVGFAALALALAPGWRRGAATALIGVAQAGGAGIAGFHVGVEAGWWQGLSDCAGGPLGLDDPSALVDALMATPAVHCDTVQIAFLGLSMAAWNGILSIALAAAAALAAWRMIARPHPASSRRRTLAGENR